MSGGTQRGDRAEPGRIPDEEIDRVNATDLRDVARRLGVKLETKGGRHTGPCPVCGSGSFTIRKDRVGKWRWDCFASGGSEGGAGGRALDLLAKGRFRHHSLEWDFRDAVEWLGGNLDAVARRDPEAERDREKRRVEEEAKAALERAEALSTSRDMWSGCVALDHPDAAPVRAYLRETRGLDLEAALGAWPASLRFGEVLPFKARPWGNHQPRPAMVAAVVKGAGAAMELVGVHRTFLTLEDGRWIKDKARWGAEMAKQTLGPISGGAVRLTKSPLIGGRHLVTEGIETGGRVVMAAVRRGGEPGRDWYLWSGLSTSGLYGLDWAGFDPESRVVMGDNDTVKRNGERPGQKAARALVARSREAGIPSIDRIPPVEGADWDDIGSEGEVRL